MVITSKSNNQPLKAQANQQVNRVGKYLFKHIDSAYDISYSVNTCEVKFLILYQIPQRLIDKYNLDNTTNEMEVYIHITTYQNKVRVNTIVKDPYERTLKFKSYEPEIFLDLNRGCKLVYQDVCQIVQKEFSDYEFIW